MRLVQNYIWLYCGVVMDNMLFQGRVLYCVFLSKNLLLSEIVIEVKG